jgi:hypothetical protein
MRWSSLLGKATHSNGPFRLLQPWTACANSLVVAVSSIAAVSADTPYRPGYPTDPFPAQAAAARLKIDPDTSCALAENETVSRNVQLAAWVECHVQGTRALRSAFAPSYSLTPLAFYPYPLAPDGTAHDWLSGFQDTFHPTTRFSWNSTKFDYDRFLNLYYGFNATIAASYGTGWQMWRDFYVSSPDSFDPLSKGGIVTGQGFNGGILKGQTAAFNAPNAAFFVVEVIDGRRWVTEFREHGTLGSPAQLPRTNGTVWACMPEYEICDTPVGST